MIRINEDYIIAVDSYNYSVKRDLHKKISTRNDADEECEKDAFATVGHYSSLAGALKGIAEDVSKRKLQSGTYSLEEAISVIIESNRYFEEILKKLDFAKENNEEEMDRDFE